MRRGKRGQSILEYVVILTAIILVVIAAAQSAIKPNAEKVMENSGTVIESGAEKLLKGTGN